MYGIELALSDEGPKIRIQDYELQEVVQNVEGPEARRVLQSIIDRADEVRHWVIADQAADIVQALGRMDTLTPEQQALREYLR
jgi:hypothetical protein